MRADARLTAVGVVLLVASAGACGRIGYEALAIDAAADRGRGGGAGGGTGGLSGTGGGAGAGGAVDGSTDAGGASGGDAADATPAISCATGNYGTHAYAFCDALVDWSAARAECEARGMRLVRIDDAGENTWVQANAVFSASMFRRDALWLGGYEPSVDGDWHWTDGDAFWLGAANGTAVGGLYTNWDKSEPNNAVGPESCVAMPLNGTTWFDWDCAAVHYFACEQY